MALTKSVAAVDDWEEIAQNTVREGAVIDVSGLYAGTLHIDVAISNTTAHTGTKIEVQISSNTTGDEDWTTKTDFIGPVGTANQANFDGAEAAGQTVLDIDVTTGFEADETRWIFIEDTGTVEDSEMALLVSYINDQNITIQDGLTNAKDTDDDLFNIADNYVVDIPLSANRVRVIYDNTYDSNGATVHTKCRITKVTEL